MIAAFQRLYKFLSRKAERMLLMMAMFFAQRVILGKTAFSEVPAALKQTCAEVLIESGLPELVPVSFGGTAEG